MSLSLSSARWCQYPRKPNNYNNLGPEPVLGSQPTVSKQQRQATVSVTTSLVLEPNSASAAITECVSQVCSVTVQKQTMSSCPVRPEWKCRWHPESGESPASDGMCLRTLFQSHWVPHHDAALPACTTPPNTRRYYHYYHSSQLVISTAHSN